MPNPADDPELFRVEDQRGDDESDKDWVVPISSRREGRERVLSLLYEKEMKGYSSTELLEELTLQPDPFVAKRFLGVSQHQSELDLEIAKLSQDWDPERMPVLDHNILLLGLFELIFCPDIPTGAILSEAVELAQAYSTESSGKFINGLLSAAARHIRS